MNALYISFPIGCLVTAILHSNNLRDIVNDREAHVRTVANLLGLKAARIEYFVLLISAYAAVIAMVTCRVVSPWCLVVLLSLPVALKNLKMIGGARLDNTDQFAMIDVMTAQLHLMFGVLLSVGLLLTALL